MNETQRHITKKGIVFLSVMCVLTYFISFILLLDCGHFSFVPKWFWGWGGLFAIVGFCIAWAFTMTLMIKKEIKIRIALIMFCLAIMAAILTWWILENSSFSFHIYG
ncbi:MAG: hypothetical protein ABSH16_02035 [Sedimentisphaerales bacterium]